MKRFDIVCGFVLVAAALAGIYIVVPAQTTLAQGFGMSPAFLPNVALTIIALLGAVLAVRAAIQPVGNDNDVTRSPIEFQDLLPSLIAFSWVFACVLLIHFTGYLVGAPALVAGLMLLWRERRIVVISLTTAIVVGLLYFLSRFVLGAQLPGVIW